MPAAAHSRVVVVVGAQAIYLHTGAIELAVAEYTTDADITIDPALLHESMSARRNRAVVCGARF
jgi:hypothetical protein